MSLDVMNLLLVLVAALAGGRLAQRLGYPATWDTDVERGAVTEVEYTVASPEKVLTARRFADPSAAARDPRHRNPDTRRRRCLHPGEGPRRR